MTFTYSNLHEQVRSIFEHYTARHNCSVSKAFIEDKGAQEINEYIKKKVTASFIDFFESKIMVMQSGRENMVNFESRLCVLSEIDIYEIIDKIIHLYNQQLGFYFQQEKQ